jgi:hypothetical protein
MGCHGMASAPSATPCCQQTPGGWLLALPWLLSAAQSAFIMAAAAAAAGLGATASPLLGSCRQQAARSVSSLTRGI